MQNPTSITVYLTYVPAEPEVSLDGGYAITAIQEQQGEWTDAEKQAAMQAAKRAPQNTWTEWPGLGMIRCTTTRVTPKGDDRLVRVLRQQRRLDQ